MAFQYSDRVRNAANDAIETTIGASPRLRIYSGTKPAQPSDAATGTLLAEITLPTDWLAASATTTGVTRKNILGTWTDAAADATGTAGYFRILDSTLANVDIQGTVTATGGGGDMTLQNTSIAAGQEITVTAFNQDMGGD